MSWGQDLWDQYDPVCTHTDQGIEFVKRIAAYVEKRIHVEQSYAKDLRKMVKQFRKKDDEESKYSACRAFSKLVYETNDLAGQRELIAEYLQADVLEPLKALSRDVTVDRRKHMAEGTELLRQLKASMEMLERSKRQYEKASEDAENAMHILEKADNDPNSTKAKIDKFTTTLRQKENTAEECRNNYILQLESTNAKRRQHYDADMPQVFQNLQNMNANRMEKYKELIGVFAESQRRVLPVVKTCLDNITAASNSVDPKQDNQQLIEDIKTGFPIPSREDVAFEEYQGKGNKKQLQKKKKVEPREDYSHLPPEQRRKKLQHKVDEVDAAINKTLSDKAAMEKMHSIYSQNPQLGDAKAVAASLEHTNGKLADLNSELDKFKTWLQQAKERPTAATSSSPRPPHKAKPDKGKPKGKVSNSDIRPQRPPTPPLQQSKEWFSDDEDADDDDIQDDGVTKSGIMLYDFDGQNEDELSVNANDKVLVIEDLGDGWLRVQKGQGEGYVPQSYVRIVDE